MAKARYAALAVLKPDDQTPMVSRIALTTTSDGAPLTLISDLSGHTAALRADPSCSLLVGEPEDRGDPLTHPRLTIQATALFIQKREPGHDALRSHYLERQPKAKLYIDFADFCFVRFDIREAFLNGGFGRAYNLNAGDLVM